MKKGLVLIIYMLIPVIGNSQSNHVKVTFKKSVESQIDSIKILSIDHNSKTSLKDSITNSLFKEGYYNHLFKKTKINDSLINFNYTLNKKYSYVEINKDPENTEKVNNIISLSRKRNVISITSIENYLNDIKKEFTQKGFSFTEIKLNKFKFNFNDTLNAFLRVSVKNKRFLDKIVVKGYEKFPIQLLKNYTNKRNLYNNQTIDKLKQSIANMPFVEKTKDPEVLFKKDSTQIFLYLEKKNTNTADGLIGFNNNNNEGKLELNGYVNLKLQNNLNRAETFLLEYRNDNGDQTQFMTSINIPYLWKSSIGSYSNLKIQRRDSTYQRTEFKTGLFYKPSWQANLGVNYTNTTSSATRDTQNNADFSKNGIEVFAEINKETSDRLMPENLYFNTTIGFNKRELENNLENQLNFYATFLKLWHLTNRSKFLSSITSYYLKSDNIQFNELYQFGGLGSIRGFNQNSIDSSFYTTLATEYRYRLNDQIYLHSILDIGVFENFNSKKVDKLYGYGGGIAILTQAGILNLSIANGRFNDAKVDLSSTVAHINLKINF